MSHAHDLAWAAGFFDGEGFVTIGRRNTKINGKEYKGHYLRVGINHVAPEPIYEMHKLFGGKVQSGHKTQGNRKPRFRWIVSTRNAANVLKQLMPYLRNKNKAAELGLEFQATIVDKPYKVDPGILLYREMLKHELVLCNAKD